MTKIVVGSSSLTQPLLYLGLGLAMLDNICGVKWACRFYYLIILIFNHLFPFLIGCRLDHCCWPTLDRSSPWWLISFWNAMLSQWMGMGIHKWEWCQFGKTSKHDDRGEWSEVASWIHKTWWGMLCSSIFTCIPFTSQKSSRRLMFHINSDFTSSKSKLSTTWYSHQFTAKGISLLLAYVLMFDN
jgi:hypothetical protein